VYNTTSFVSVLDCAPAGPQPALVAEGQELRQGVIAGVLCGAAPVGKVNNKVRVRKLVKTDDVRVIHGEAFHCARDTAGLTSS
jgi:hypothetical protein